MRNPEPFSMKTTTRLGKYFAHNMPVLSFAHYDNRVILSFTFHREDDAVLFSIRYGTEDEAKNLYLNENRTKTNSLRTGPMKEILEIYARSINKRCAGNK